MSSALLESCEYRQPIHPIKLTINVTLYTQLYAASPIKKNLNAGRIY